MTDDDETVEAMDAAAKAAFREALEVGHDRKAASTIAMRAALAVVREREGWRPIETAHQSSAARLLWVPERQSIFCATYQGAPHQRHGWAIFGGDWREFLQRATHWRPLPAPPEGTA